MALQRKNSLSNSSRPTNGGSNTAVKQVNSLAARVKTMAIRRQLRAISLMALSAFCICTAHELVGIEDIGALFMVPVVFCALFAYWWKQADINEHICIQHLSECTEMDALGPLVVAFNQLVRPAAVLSTVDERNLLRATSGRAEKD